MRTIKLLFLVIFLAGAISCDNEDKGANISVKEYIQLLKANKYTADNLPAFTAKDIPALLAYRNETQLISNFPGNPISSMYLPSCKLGMYVLWTIESIRAVSINSKYLIQRFPSQQPILASRESPELKVINDDLSHQLAAKAYYEWWESNKTKEFNSFSNLDPLATTKYRWH
ncbi:MAG: DUF4943 family protein [Adhaeribacter sp.]